MASRWAGPTSRKTATAANVQCQKCLKRGHYSYECKENVQDRPYTARPSRTQRLRNPKLAPKLTTDTPAPLENKKGVADQLLAKREAERARNRSDDGSEDNEQPRPKRGRARSCESGSSSSFSGRSPSPPPERTTRSPRAEEKRQLRRGPSPGASRRPRTASPAESKYRTLSRSPEGGPRRSRAVSRSRSRSPMRSRSRSREPLSRRNYRHTSKADPRPDARSYSRGPKSKEPRRRYSKSPVPSPRNDAHARRSEHRYTNRQSDDSGRREQKPLPRRRETSPAAAAPAPAPAPARERSLSPFSKRLAMTQAMNMRR